VAERHHAYAFRIADRLRAEGHRVELHGADDGPLGARIRRAKLEKVPYVLVVGDDDVENGTVGVNERGSDTPERGVPIERFSEHVKADVLERR
jgi:threonyl-tRNA synthetase